MASAGFLTDGVWQPAGAEDGGSDPRRRAGAAERAPDRARPALDLARGRLARHDARAAVSLAYGVLFAVVGWAMTFGLWWADMIYLILPLTAAS